MLHPSYFGPRMVEYLENKLMSDVEGTCSGKFGYIICVLTVTDVGAGIVLPGNGQAEFIARYRAIVFKPFKGEVLEGIVGEVSKVPQKLDTFSSRRSSSKYLHRWVSSRRLDPSISSCRIT